MDRETVLELFDRYGDMVYRIALSYLRSRQEAEDTVQAVFLKLLEGKAAPHEGKERAYLTKTTANYCKNILRSAKQYVDTPLEELALLAPPEERELFLAIMELPEKYRSVMTLHYLEGYSFREIAQILHIGPSAVSMRLFRAKDILKQQLGREQ